MDIRISFPGGKRVDAAFGSYHVETDQPAELGGTGAAPAPYDLFLTSIATCAGVYALGFCQARGIDTAGLSLVQRHDFDPATHLLSHVRLELVLPAGFPERHRAGLQRAVDLCKVKKTLAAPPHFEVVLSGTEEGACVDA